MDHSPITIRTVFFGTGDVGLPSLQTLIDLRAKPVLVVTSPDKPAGRGLKLMHSPIKELALHAGIPILQPANVNDPDVVDRIRQYGADLGVIIAYGQKIGPVLINAFPQGIINLHTSLLPKYRGAAPINWVLVNGETQTGLTVMQINADIDAGMILNQLTVPIDPLERADELHDRLAQLGPQLVVETVFQIQQGNTDPKPQDPALATKAPKLSKALSPVDWSLSADRIANRIRGLWPWPTATAVYRPGSGKPIPVALARAQAIPECECYIKDRRPGLILGDYTVITGKGRLKILELKPAGSKLMHWQDFINGRHVKPGDVFTAMEPAGDEKPAAQYR
jgi:methionyl-tRNA formyltransferase